MMVKHILNGGKTLRREASSSINAAIARIDILRAQSEESARRAGEHIALVDAANERARKVLPPNHAKLYRLAALEDIASPAPTRTAVAPLLEIKIDQLPPLPSLAASVGLGSGAGIAVAAAIAWGTTLGGPALGLLLIPVLAGSLCGALVQGKRAETLSARYQDCARATHVEVDAYVRRMEQIIRSAGLHLTLTAHLERLALQQQSQLQTVAADTTISAMLLRDVLNTPLLNEEGAFIQEVIDQLHDQGERVEQFKHHLASAAG